MYIHFLGFLILEDAWVGNISADRYFHSILRSLIEISDAATATEKFIHQDRKANSLPTEL